jgi:hypothetical protein
MDYENHFFTDQLVDLDGNTFKDCTFEGCVIRYGGGNLELENPRFRDQNRFEFINGVDPTDNLVLRFLKAGVVLNGGTIGSDAKAANDPQVTPKKDLS